MPAPERVRHYAIAMMHAVAAYTMARRLMSGAICQRYADMLRCARVPLQRDELCHFSTSGTMLPLFSPYDVFHVTRRASGASALLMLR